MRQKQLPPVERGGLMLLQKLGRDDMTAHGFRSAFREWCAGFTDVPGDVAAAVVAHAVGRPVCAADRRCDVSDRRRDLMARRVWNPDSDEPMAGAATDGRP